jgi:hypothetical protein
MNMEIILTTSVEGLGDRGDIVRVKEGYARNYLLPRKMALPATDAMKKVMSEENKLRDIRGDKEKRAMLEVAGKMKDISVTIVVQAGEEDKLFGWIRGRPQHGEARGTHQASRCIHCTGPAAQGSRSPGQGLGSKRIVLGLLSRGPFPSVTTP